MEQHFCHEGYVLPGGKVIAGRWCDTRADPNDETTASGPFIWWNVDRSLEPFVAVQRKAGLQCFSTVGLLLRTQKGRGLA
jgi:hypothetical protein